MAYGWAFVWVGGLSGRHVGFCAGASLGRQPSRQRGGWTLGQVGFQVGRWAGFVAVIWEVSQVIGLWGRQTGIGVHRQVCGLWGGWAFKWAGEWASEWACYG